MPDPNLSRLEDAARKLAAFLEEIVFVGGVTLGILITDEAAAPIRGTNDVDVIAEIITYADYIAFSERLREANFTKDAGEQALTCGWHHCWLQSAPPPNTLLCRHRLQSYATTSTTHSVADYDGLRNIIHAHGRARENRICQHAVSQNIDLQGGQMVFNA